MNKLRTVLAWLVHLYTASGAVAAVAMLLAIVREDYPAAFLWYFVASLIDFTDGTFARAVAVRQHAASVDGDQLNTAVDFLVIGFLPVYLLIRSGALPDPWWLWGGLVLVGTAYRFAVHNPISQHGFFWGIPPFWGIVVFYIHHYGLTGPAVAALTVAYTALCFLPIGYVHTSRFPRGRVLGSLLLTAWWVLYLVVSQGWVADPTPWLHASLLYFAYYFGFSWLRYRDLRRELRMGRGGKAPAGFQRA